MRISIIAAFILTAFNTLCVAQAASRSDGTLTVVGHGRVVIPPEQVNLTAEVVTRGKNPEEATTLHRERVSRAVSRLREMGKDGLQIEQSNFRLTEFGPAASSTTQMPAPIEYRAMTSFELKLSKLDVIDQLITAVASTGWFEVRNLRFGIGDRNPGLKEACKNAVADARQRATTYAEAAGVKLSEIIKIEDNDQRGPRDFAVATPIARNVQVIPPDTLTLSATITMTWRIESKP